MRKLLLTAFGIASIFMLSSSFKNENIKNNFSSKNDKYLKRTDTLNIIDKECALLLKRKSQDIADMRKEFESEEDFYVAADDMNYYNYMADEYLENKAMRIIYVDTTYSVINFQNKHFINILDKTKNIIFSVILYKEGKKPIAVAPIDVSAEYDKYFLE